MKRLKDKVAVVYGDGNVGCAIAKAFAREGARVFMTGRTLKKLEAIADASLPGGEAMEIAQLDAMDEQAVEKHMSYVIKNAGKVDIVFNAIGIPQKGIQGIPLTELSLESYLLPVTTYAQAHFVTAKAAARRMVQQGLWCDPYAYAQCEPDKSSLCGWHGACLGRDRSALPVAVGGMWSAGGTGCLPAHDGYTGNDAH